MFLARAARQRPTPVTVVNSPGLPCAGHTSQAAHLQGKWSSPAHMFQSFLVTGQKHKGPRDCLYCLRLLTPKQILHGFSFTNSFMLQCQKVNSISGEKHKCLECLLKSWCRAQIEVDDCQRHLGAPPASAPKSSSGANENCSIQVTANRARARNLTLKKD